MPLYVGPEYKVLADALALLAVEEEAAMEGTGERSGEEAVDEAKGAVSAAARELATCVQVATAQVKDLQPIEVLLANHYAMQEELRSLRGEVTVLRETIAAWSPAVVPSARASTSRQSKGGRTSTGAGAGRSRGAGGRFVPQTDNQPLSGDGDLGGRVGGDSDSELSDPADRMDEER